MESTLVSFSAAPASAFGGGDLVSRVLGDAAARELVESLLARSEAGGHEPARGEPAPGRGAARRAAGAARAHRSRDRRRPHRRPRRPPRPRGRRWPDGPSREARRTLIRVQPPGTDPSPDSPVDEGLFRRTAGRFATGVCAVTTRAAGIDHAMTVNTFTSVSLEPLLVLVCVEVEARFHDAVLDAGVWGVSVLDASARPVAEWLATRGRPLHGQLDRVPHHRGPVTGVALLDQSVGDAGVPHDGDPSRRRPHDRRRRGAVRGGTAGRRPAAGVASRWIPPDSVTIRPPGPFPGP